MTDEPQTKQESRLPLATAYEWFNRWYASSEMSDRWHVWALSFPDGQKEVEFTVRSGSINQLLQHGYSAFDVLKPDDLDMIPLSTVIHQICVNAASNVQQSYGKRECTLDIRVVPTSIDDGYSVLYRTVVRT